MNDKTLEACRAIANEREQAEAIVFLTQSIQKSLERIEKHNSHRAACLRAIKKINKGKDSAIDALCEPDLRSEMKRWCDNDR